MVRLNLLEVLKKGISERWFWFGLSHHLNLLETAGMRGTTKTSLGRLDLPAETWAITWSSWAEQSAWGVFPHLSEVFHTPQKSRSHPMPRGAFVCWPLSQLSVTRKWKAGRGCGAHRSRFRDYLCWLDSSPRVTQALSGQNKQKIKKTTQIDGWLVFTAVGSSRISLNFQLKFGLSPIWDVGDSQQDFISGWKLVSGNWSLAPSDPGLTLQGRWSSSLALRDLHKLWNLAWAALEAGQERH